MTRRDFLRRAGLVAAGVIAADQLELVERLGWKRRFFPGWSRPTLYGDGIHDDTEAFQALFDGREVYDAFARQVIGGRNVYFVANRHIRLTGTVYARPDSRGDGTISSCFIEGSPHVGNRPLIHITGPKVPSIAQPWAANSFRLEA